MTTPILDFVHRYTANAPVRFHMPGHKGEVALGCEPLDLTEIEEADTVIVEIVERNLTNLLAYAPKMAAPAREMPTATAEGKYVTAKAIKSSNYVKVSGLTDGVADRIYLAVDGVAYEATPIAEGDAAADNGFTAYLPADCAGQPITLLYEQDGQWINAGTIS